MAAVNTQEIHNLSLRVMRLARPSFSVQAPVITAFKEDFAAGGVSVVHTGGEGLGLSPFLSLPAHFGDIHQGETFSCYVSVLNHSNEAVMLDQIKCELQFSTRERKVPLVDSKEPNSFDVGTRSDYVITQKIEEAGVHILVCICSYIRLSGEKKWFRKFFKFHVTCPFIVKPRVVPLPHGLAVQVSVTNNSSRAIYVESVEIDPHTVPSVYKCTNVSSKTNANTVIKGLPSDILGSMMYMQVGDCRQFLFLYEAKELDKLEPKRVGGPIGTVWVRWKSALGETGEHTSEIHDNAPDRKKYSILVSSLPSKFFLEEVFTLQFHVQNRSEVPIRPQLVATLGSKAGVQVFGNCSGVAPEVAPGTLSSPISLSFLPLRSGIQPLPRIVLHDLRTGSQYDWGTFTSTTGMPIPFAIFVEKHDEKVQYGSLNREHIESNKSSTNNTSVSDIVTESGAKEIVQDQKQEVIIAENQESIETPIDDEVVTPTPSNERKDNGEHTAPATVENIDLAEGGDTKGDELATTPATIEPTQAET